MTWTDIQRRSLIYLFLVLVLLATTGCDGTQSSEPEAGVFLLENDTKQNICHLYFAPLAQEQQEFDVIAFASDRGEIAAGDTFRLASADHARLRDDVEYTVSAESCAGDTAELGGTVHFPTGLVWGINEW